MKTHKPLVTGVVQDLLSNRLAPYAGENQTKPRTKFLLFILDDMVEHLGPTYLGPQYVSIV